MRDETSETVKTQSKRHRQVTRIHMQRIWQTPTAKRFQVHNQMSLYSKNNLLRGRPAPKTDFLPRTYLTSWMCSLQCRPENTDDLDEPAPVHDATCACTTYTTPSQCAQRTTLIGKTPARGHSKRRGASRCWRKLFVGGGDMTMRVVCRTGKTIGTEIKTQKKAHRTIPGRWRAILHP